MNRDLEPVISAVPHVGQDGHKAAQFPREASSCVCGHSGIGRGPDSRGRVAGVCDRGGEISSGFERQRRRVEIGAGIGGDRAIDGQRTSAVSDKLRVGWFSFLAELRENRIELRAHQPQFGAERSC